MLVPLRASPGPRRVVLLVLMRNCADGCAAIGLSAPAGTVVASRINTGGGIITHDDGRSRWLTIY